MPIRKRSYPRFFLTNSVPVTITRKGEGHYEFGQWVDGGTTEIVIDANVQPLKMGELMLLTESDRQKEWIKIFSVSEMREAIQGKWDADLVEWQEQTYMVMRTKNYVMGVLDHFCSYAARVEISAGS